MSQEEKNIKKVDNQTPLDRIIEKLGRPFSYIFALSCIVIVYEVVARYVFNAPTKWGHDTTTLLCALCFFYGGAYCLARNTHIRIVLIYDKVSPKIRRFLDIFINFTGVVWGCFLIYAAKSMVQKSWFSPNGELRLETTASAWDPPFPAYIKAFLAIMLVVMTLQFVLKLIQAIRGR